MFWIKQIQIINLIHSYFDKCSDSFSGLYCKFIVAL
jgi:hypothetical protein